MNLTFFLPTRLILDENCVSKNAAKFTECGKKAMIVTGKNSAKASGALDDVVAVLEQGRTEWILFDKIENNPSMETVEEAGKIAKAEGVDFVIGIGGGSPIDAAKAIAVLAANDMKTTDLFLNQFTKALKILAVPTTAGTGSEATPYSVLLRKDLQTKMGFGNPLTFPVYAFLDAKYTVSLSKNFTISTAVDAFTHCLEGYMANRSTIMSDAIALSAIEAFGRAIPALGRDTLTLKERELLLYISMIGGVTIAQTGVTAPHGLGYCYTYFKDVPHGVANGYFMREYLKLHEEVRKDKVASALAALGYTTIDAFADALDTLIGPAPALTAEEVEEYTKLSLLQKGSLSNTPYPMTEDSVHSLWTKMARL